MKRRSKVKNFEDKLNDLKIPSIESDPFENKLRRDLIQKFYAPEKKYKRNLRLAVGFACLLAIFGCSTILNPEIAYKINRLTFKKNVLSKIELQGRKLIPIESDMAYTSIRNPALYGKINPADYIEDKAFLIRRYTSDTEGSVMIVSEFKQTPKIPKKKILY